MWYNDINTGFFKKSPSITNASQMVVAVEWFFKKEIAFLTPLKKKKRRQNNSHYYSFVRAEFSSCLEMSLTFLLLWKTILGGSRFYFVVPGTCNNIIIHLVALARRQQRGFFGFRVKLPQWWLHTVRFYCWTSSRKAVNTNFYSL